MVGPDRAKVAANSTKNTTLQFPNFSAKGPTVANDQQPPMYYASTCSSCLPLHAGICLPIATCRCIGVIIDCRASTTLFSITSLFPKVCSHSYIFGGKNRPIMCDVPLDSSLRVRSNSVSNILDCCREGLIQKRAKKEVNFFSTFLQL